LGRSFAGKKIRHGGAYASAYHPYELPDKKSSGEKAPTSGDKERLVGGGCVQEREGRTVSLKGEHILAAPKNAQCKSKRGTERGGSQNVRAGGKKEKNNAASDHTRPSTGTGEARHAKGYPDKREPRLLPKGNPGGRAGGRPFRENVEVQSKKRESS